MTVTMAVTGETVNVVLVAMVLAVASAAGLVACVPQVGLAAGWRLWRHAVALAGARATYRALVRSCVPPGVAHTGLVKDTGSSATDAAATENQGPETAGHGRGSVVSMPAEPLLSGSKT